MKLPHNFQVSTLFHGFGDVQKSKLKMAAAIMLIQQAFYIYVNEHSLAVRDNIVRVGV